MIQSTIGCLLLLLSGVLTAGVPEQAHPRLLFPRTEEAVVKARIANDPVAAKLHAELVKCADKILQERTSRYEIPDGKRLLSESRRAIENVVQPGLLWRLGGKDEYRQRVVAELDAACALKDWNPSHFLDTAEMATAVAIGYDWLYDSLSEEQRKRYETALIEKALKPAAAVYAGKGWWTNGRNNWAQVCGAGIGLAAVAVWEEEPELCESLFRKGVALVERCGRFYHPDGCYPEGPGYWHYGTNYHVLLLAACESLGEPMEVEPTLRKSGDFILQVIGPTGYDFNFADGRARKASTSPAQCWIARRFGDQGQARMVRDWIVRETANAAGGRLSALSLIWLPKAAENGTSPLSMFSMVGGEQSMAFLRTGWSEEAAWLAIKGGTGAASHGHMDVGSFVYEAGGQRWFVDLGSDNYNMPSYFGDKRWTYFRLNNRSHNTLMIGDRLQEAPEAPCRIVGSGVDGPRRWVEIDLKLAYEGQVREATRRATLDQESGMTMIEDTIVQPVGPVRWAVMTDAKVTIEGRRVFLEKKGRRLILEREDEEGGAWEVSEARPPTKREKQNEGSRLVSFTAPQSDQLKLNVRWQLESKAPSSSPPTRF